VCPDDDVDAASLQRLALSADLIVLDAVPTSEPAADAANAHAHPRDFLAHQLGVLGALRHSQHLCSGSGRTQRLVLLSSVTTWGKLAVAEVNKKLAPRSLALAQPFFLAIQSHARAF
jgi:hypothetical protein